MPENEQLALFDVPPPPPKQDDRKRRNWENGFQRWSDKVSQIPENQPLGVCGYGSMCDYCADNTYGRPCVRALNDMCRDKRISIDYDSRDYESVWNGDFRKGNER